MRRLLLAAAMFGVVSGAQAADMPDLPILRGSYTDGLSKSGRNWEGWYVGGDVSYSSANVDFSQSVVGQTNYIFRNSVLQQPTSQLSLLNKANTQGTGFGAFVGRNFQWEDVVLGVEANYNYLNNLSASASGSIGPLTITNPSGDNPPPGVTDLYGVKLQGSAAAQIRDVITFRGRAGWAFGDFLPYMFGGLAVGRIDVARSVSSTATLQQATTTTNAITGVTSTTYGPVNPLPQVSGSQTQDRTNYAVGWTAGIGMEYCLWGGLFLRGEWEYIKFMSVENTSISVNSARAGLGWKF